MKRTMIWIVAVGGVFLLLRLFVYVFPEALCLFLSCSLAVGLLILFGISLKEGVTTWRKTSVLWLLPTLICLEFILVGVGVMPALGPPIADWLFVRNLNAYSGVVGDFRKGAISCMSPCTGEMVPMHLAHRPPGIRNAWGVHCDDGGAIVMLFVNTDVLLLHEGYFFKEYGDGSNCALQSLSPEVGWPRVRYVRHVAGQWYHFSDAPGL